MRFLLFALMILGLMTGGPLRAAECDKTYESVPVSDCCSGHDDERGHPDSQCPEGHHHHGICCHVSPAMSAEDEDKLELLARSAVRLSLRPQSEAIPEGPFLSSEKPPLI